MKELGFSLNSHPPIEKDVEMHLGPDGVNMFQGNWKCLSLHSSFQKMMWKSCLIFLSLKVSSHWIIICPTEQTEIIYTGLFMFDLAYLVRSWKDVYCRETGFDLTIMFSSHRHTKNLWFLGCRHQLFWLLEGIVTIFASSLIFSLVYAYSQNSMRAQRLAWTC